MIRMDFVRLPPLLTFYPFFHQIEGYVNGNHEIQKKLDYKETINKILYVFASLKFWRYWSVKIEGN